MRWHSLICVQVEFVLSVRSDSELTTNSGCITDCMSSLNLEWLEERSGQALYNQLGDCFVRPANPDSKSRTQLTSYQCVWGYYLFRVKIGKRPNRRVVRRHTHVIQCHVDQAVYEM